MRLPYILHSEKRLKRQYSYSRKPLRLHLFWTFSRKLDLLHSSHVLADPNLNKNMITIVSKAKGMIAKCRIEVKGVRKTDSYFEFILSAMISQDFPVMYSWCEATTGNCCPEKIALLFQETVSVPVSQLDTATRSCRIPTHIGRIASSSSTSFSSSSLPFSFLLRWWWKF